MREIGDSKTGGHLFDGMALLHHWRVDGSTNSVQYKNRFLRSDTYVRNMKANRIVVSEFGTRGKQTLI